MLALAAALLWQAQEPQPSVADVWERFPVFVWRQRYREEAPPEELIAPFGGVNVERDEDPEWLFERGYDFYVGHGPGRNDLHIDPDRPSWKGPWEAWYETRDPKHLVREPCLTDPETADRLHDQLERTLKARKGRHGIGVSLGDEVSFTPAGNPWDGCRSPTCAAGFAETVHGRTGKAVPTTDAVRLALADGDRTLLEPWLARRRFHKNVLESLLFVLRDSAERSQGVPVGLLGVAGETAFGGVSQRVLSGLDFVECYPVLDTQELFYTARNGRTPRSLRTVFLAGEGPAGVAWQAWEHWMRGGDGLIVWCDADLEDMPARRGRLAGAVSDLRRVRAEVPDFAPAPRGVALLHDWKALAGGFLSDALLDGPTWPRRFASYQREHGRVERATRAWLRWLEDSGYQPGAVTDRPSTERFPVLIAWDEVFRPDPRIDTYLDRRLSPKGRVPFASIDGGLLEAAGVERAPWELTGEAAVLPWLSTWSRDAKGTGWVCATIPNLVSKEERNAHLRELVLEIAPPAGMDLVWVHPPADEAGPRTLPAGDAAVFRLVPR